jgi:hypothetical protein
LCDSDSDSFKTTSEEPSAGASKPPAAEKSPEKRADDAAAAAGAGTVPAVGVKGIKAVADTAAAGASDERALPAALMCGKRLRAEEQPLWKYGCVDERGLQGSLV